MTRRAYLIAATIGAAGLTLAVARRPAAGGYVMADGRPCGVEGETEKPGVRTLNRLKNRATPPTAADVDRSVTLAALLTPGEDENRFDARRAAVVSGYCIAVKPGGRESCNCGAADEVDRDTHIEVGAGPTAPPRHRVIVEVTPRLRKRNANWQTPALEKTLTGHWVQITGWLFFDAEHVGAAENTHPGNPTNWRATCWEVHPVTGVEVLAGKPADAPAPVALAAMQFAHAVMRRLNPALAARDSARGRRAQELFGDDDD